MVHANLLRRVKLELPRATLAVEMGVPETDIAVWEKGLRTPTPRQLARWDATLTHHEVKKGERK